MGKWRKNVSVSVALHSIAATNISNVQMFVCLSFFLVFFLPN